MFIVVIMSIISFLLLGEWSIMQHTERMQQAISYEYKGLQRSEFISAAALYALQFFKAHVRLSVADYTTEVQFAQYRVAYVFTQVTSTSAQVRIVIREQGQNSAYEYRIFETDGVLHCMPVN